MTAKGWAEILYRWRWLAALLVLVTVIGVFATGIGFVGTVTNSVLKVGDVSDGQGSLEPQMFDPSLDVWFGGDDSAVATRQIIEDRFIAEDYVVLAFDVEDAQAGVFDREALKTIARLTDRLLQVPGVRHVRSLTHNPWIRLGQIDNEDTRGLIVTDLIAGDIDALSERDIAERMIAAIGAQATADRLDDDLVRDVIGDDAAYGDYVGEPLALGTLIDANAQTTAIQVQVVRPHLSDNAQAAQTPLTAPLYSVHQQRGALRAIDRILAEESGHLQPTRAFQREESRLLALPNDPSRNDQLRTLRDPSTNFWKDTSGETLRKFHLYEETEDGNWIDRYDAEADEFSSFTPQPLSPYHFRVAGVPRLERNFETIGKADAGLLPGTLLVIFLMLFVVFRRFSSALIPLLVVLISIIGTVGSVFFTGHLFNNLTAMTPNMIIAIGVADAVHLIAAWVYLRPQFDDKRSLIVATIEHNIVPILLTSITTAVGFYSLLLIDLQPVRELAWTMGFGALLAFSVTMTLVPAMLSLVPLPKLTEKRQNRQGVFSAQRSERWANWVNANRVRVLVSFAAITSVALFGLSRLQIDADTRIMFPATDPVIMDMNWMDEALAGVGELEVLFSTTGAVDDRHADERARLETLQVKQLSFDQDMPDSKPLSSAEQNELGLLLERKSQVNRAAIGASTLFLSQLDRFERRLRQEMTDPKSPLRFLGDLYSPLDVLRKMHQVQNNNRSDFYRVPLEDDVSEATRADQLRYDEFEDSYWRQPGQDASTLAAQYYLQYENGARPGESLATLLTPDRRYVRMLGRLKQGSSNERNATYQRIRQIAEQEFPLLTGGKGAISELGISGKTLLSDNAGLVIAKSYSRSLAVALLVISAFIGLIFRSVKLAVLSVLPNIVPVILPVGLFGLLGAILDGPAIVACSIALGVCVDDTIHFFAKYRDAKRIGLGDEKAIAHAFSACGNALTVTTVVLSIGFSMMLMSHFSPNFYIGALATSMILLAWVSNFLVTPAALLTLSSTDRAASATAPAVQA